MGRWTDNFDGYEDGEIVPQGGWQGASVLPAFVVSGELFVPIDPADSIIVEHALANTEDPQDPIDLEQPVRIAFDCKYTPGAEVGPSGMLISLTSDRKTENGWFEIRSNPTGFGETDHHFFHFFGDTEEVVVMPKRHDVWNHYEIVRRGTSLTMHRNGVVVQASTIDPATWVGDTAFLSLFFEPSADVAEWRVDNFVIENLAAIGGGRPVNLGLSLGL